MSTGMVCKNIEKSYGKKEVLKGINLELEKGKIYGLIGRNGAGKTTLLSVITGQNPLSGGTVELDGMPVWENEKALGNVCFSRELNFSPNSAGATMKVKEYLKAASIYFPHWDAKMAEELVNEFELETKKAMSKLSKGMLSMVTIIVALASKAQYTFLDEPVAGLDVVARENFYRILLDEYAESGRTFVISTHIIEEAADVFEEVIIINKGKLLRKENTLDLTERSWHVSGLAADIDAVKNTYDTCHEEKMGRSKGITVLLKSGQSLEDLKKTGDVSVQPMTLQQIFVALCGKEEAVDGRS